MLRLIIIFLLSGSTLCAQQTVLPYFRDGKWGMIDTNGRELTSTPYEYIHIFDKAGTTFFAHESRYGILDTQGKELTTNEFDDIIQLGFGNYNVKSNNEWKIISFVNGKRFDFFAVDEGTIVQLSEGWLEKNKQGKKSFINLKSRITIECPDTISEYSVWQEYLFIKTKKELAVYTPDGDTLVKSNWGYMDDVSRIDGASATYYEVARCVSAPGKLYIIDDNGLWTLPQADNYYCSDTIVFIYNNGTGTLYDRATRKPIVTGPYTNIWSYDSKYWFVDNYYTNSNNLLSKTTKKLVFPATTSYFSPIPQGYVVYDKNGLCTALNKQFQSIIPGKFNSVRFTANDLVYTIVNTSQGLYSLKSKSYLLPSIYSEISNTKDRYKGIFKDNYCIIQLDKNHKIINRIDGKNNLYVPTKSKNQKSPYFDPRLFPMGWFVDSSQTVTKGDEVATLYRWGLKDFNDSLLLKPMLGDLNYVVGPFAYSKSKERLIDLPNGTQANASFMQFYAHKNGKSAGPSTVLWCDTLDFMTRSLMRLYTSKGYGFITENGTFKQVLYIQLNDSPVLRYCYEGGYELTKDTKDELTTEIQPSLLMKQGNVDAKTATANMLAIQNTFGFRSKYPGGKWNYLGPNGENLFSEPFDFAFEFVGSCAIAVRDGKWGVVNHDTVVVPFIFNHIERIIYGKDTLFKTELTPRGNRYLDTTLNVLSIQNHIKSSSAFNVIEVNNQQHIWNSGYEDIVDPQSSFKLYNDGYFSYKKDKQNHLHDSTGTLLCSTKRKIERVIGDSYFVFEDGSNLGVADFFDTVVVTAGQLEITETTNTFQVTTRNGSTVYTKRFKTILEVDEGTLLVDPISEKIAHLFNNGVTIYSSTGKKFAKLKEIKPIAFFNDALAIKGKTFQLIDLTGKQILEVADMEGTSIFPNNWYSIKSDKRGWILYNEQWKEVQPTTLPIRRIDYHGEGIFSFWDKSLKYTVINFTNGKKIDKLSGIEGDITEGSLLVKEVNNAYFIDAQMEPINRFHYLDASPYVNGYAAVKDSRGWTIVGLDAKPITYPSFPQITFKGPNLYVCPKQSVFGLYDSNGKQLIRENNERLTFVKPTIVQCVSMGEIFYYTNTGQKLF